MTRGLIVAASLALSAVASGQTGADQQTIERSFSEGGIVTLNLSSGDYTVRAGANDRVRVQWRADDAEHEKDMKKITVVSDVFERVLTIRTKGPTKPRPLHDRDSGSLGCPLAGACRRHAIEGIEGNKDVRMTAGDLYIDVQPDSLRHVHASVSIGDLNARSLGIEKDGFRNSLDWFGDGRYTLDARLFAGDVVLR